MRWIQVLVFFVLLLFGLYLTIDEWDLFKEDRAVNAFVWERATHVQEKVVRHPVVEEDLYHWINQPINKLEQTYGQPLRRDLSAYGYTWWVYTDKKNEYVQFGVYDNKIKTIFATGNDLSIGSVQVGQSYEEVAKNVPFESKISYLDGESSYEFKLTMSDLMTQPLIQLSDGIFLQCYFDVIKNKLSSVRLLTADILLLHAPYEIQFRGDLPEGPFLSDEQWLEVEDGMANQIFLITNIKRNQYGVNSLQWDQDVTKVALLHSQDMEKNNYFSHYSINGDGLKERLDAGKIFYLSAGENIAAQYPDAPAAIEGWLNSQGHRDALLKENYTHLGVGVHRLYFTQNFIAKP